ncbi:MAG: TraB/GumN family protein [Bacteroidota bacterium]
MKNSLFSFLFLFVLVACGTSQKAVDAPTTVPKSPTESWVPTSDDNSLLWEIRGAGLSQPSYLFGTIHMITKDDFFLSDSTIAAFKASDKVVFEIDMNEMNDPAILFSLITQAMMADGITLKDLVSAEDYKLVDAHFTKMGLPMYLLDRVKPMFLAMMASGDLSGDELQSGEIKSYEMEFMKMAEVKNKAVGGLETLAYQMSVFDSIPYAEQATMLVDAIKSEDQGTDEFTEMIRLYKTQNIAEMYNMFKTDPDSPSNFESVLLTNRNQNWIPVMEKIASEQSTFFAVGAGHLGGEDGVIALMRKAGYTLRPIFQAQAGAN